MTSAAEDKCLNIRAEVQLNGKELQGNALFRPALAALCTGQGRPCNSISGGTGPSSHLMTDLKHMFLDQMRDGQR